MNRKFLKAVLLMLGAGVALPVAVQAQPVWTPVGDPLSCDDTANTYQLFAHVSGSKSWSLARDFADEQSDGAVPGHLATITSQSENDCIVELFSDDANRETWLGGYQPEACTALPGGVSQAECGWTWITEEGTFGPQNNNETPDNTYVNWMPDEPNDLGGNESHLGIFLNRSSQWNDEGNLGNIGFLIVEYTRTLNAVNCFGTQSNQDPNDGQGCRPSGGQEFELLPSDNIGPDETVTEYLLEPGPSTTAALQVGPGVCTGPNAYLDPRVDANGFPVDRRKLYVFDELGGRPAGIPASYELVLDEFTYGFPCFAVAFGEWTVDGTLAYPDGYYVTRLQFPEDIEGLGPVTQCYDANDPVFSDLQNISQLSYQTDDRFEMQGETAEAVTNACFNPSRGSTVKFSFGVINTHEHCGIHPDSKHAKLKILGCFHGLANHKAWLLDESLRDARWTLSNRDYNKLNKELAKAQVLLFFGAYRSARSSLERFRNLIDTADFETTSDNHPGHLIMRAENLAFRAEMLELFRRN